jgi:2-oxoglutarate dehydrogenase E2 component (dihydrolipoamide succinyltransferase)
MATEIKVPTLGESVTTATVARWLKKAGEAVAVDEPVVELETDKVTVEVPSPGAGTLGEIHAQEGAEVEVGAVLALLEAGSLKGPAPAANPSAGVNPPPVPRGPVSRPATTPAEAPSAAVQSTPHVATHSTPHPAMPSAAKLMEERGLTDVPGTGKDGRVTKGDVLSFMSRPAAAAAPSAPKAPRETGDGEERVKMTRLRRTIAQRLKEAQNNAAMLTTFNEVDMSAAMALRAEYKDAFEKKNKGVRLGFMSFFVRACVAALQEFPAVNAEIDGDDVVYKNFVHMGIAVGGPNGLVVPVVRNADKMGFAEIEGSIASFGKRARDGQLKLEELSGGTFTITNGGVYGSLMSTPILNAPQSGILGMHKIQERPMAINGKVEIRPMMYLALSYDHRIVDGKEAVSFLVRVKEGVEDPRRLLLGL